MIPGGLGGGVVFALTSADHLGRSLEENHA